MLLIHPDFLWKSNLGKTIRKYDYFSYAVHEALFLSEREEKTVIAMMHTIDQEHRANTEKFSKDIMIAQLELLLAYGERFYNRQFITRKISNHKLLDRLKELLSRYFAGDLPAKGLPTVAWIASSLNTV